MPVTQGADTLPKDSANVNQMGVLGPDGFLYFPQRASDGGLLIRPTSGMLSASGNLKVSIEEVEGSTVLPVETNVSRYYQDSISAHGLPLLSFDLTVTANNATIITAPAAGSVIRLYRANYISRIGATVPVYAGLKFTTAGTVFGTSLFTAEGVPGGPNISPNYIQGADGAGLFSSLLNDAGSTMTSEVHYTGFYRVVVLADEPAEV